MNTMNKSFLVPGAAARTAAAENIHPHPSHTIIRQMKRLGVMALWLWWGAAGWGQAPVVASLGQNGLLVCTNLQPGSTASVEWASSVLGPWTNNWAGLAALTADSNGMLQVSVPMFYRVRGLGDVRSMGVPSNMALIPAGSFTMGNCMDSSDGYPDELPLHTVYVSAFYMDQYDVTKALWDDVCNWATNHGYSFDYGADGKATNHPVQMVNWYDAVKWCNARSEKEGRRPAYYANAAQTVVYRSGEIDLGSSWVNWTNGFRLPTEAEWEKAARGGASGQGFPWGNTISWSQANYLADLVSDGGFYAYDVNPTSGFDPAFDDGTNPYTSPVDYFAPNGCGLYDMAGNVNQWCWDWYGSYSSGSQSDPRGPTSGQFRMNRGGSWISGADFCRAAGGRGYSYPSGSYYSLGFRSVLPPGQ